MPKAMIIPGESRLFGQIWKGILADMGFEIRVNGTASSLDLREIQTFNLVVMKGDVNNCISLRQNLGKIAILAVINDPYAEEEAAEYEMAERRIDQKIRSIRGSTITEEEPKESMTPPQKGLDVIRFLLKNKIGFYYTKQGGDRLDQYKKMQEAVLMALALVS